MAIAPDSEALVSDNGRDAVLEYTPSLPADVEILDQEDAGATPEP